MHDGTNTMGSYKWRLLVGLLLIMMLVIPTAQANNRPEDKGLSGRGKAAVDRYLEARDRAKELAKYRPDKGNDDTGETPEEIAYKLFLYDVLNGNHPDVFANGEGEAVTTFASQTLGLEADTETEDADPSGVTDPGKGKGKVKNGTSFRAKALYVSYNRTNAVNYANNWAYSPSDTGKKRNDSYVNLQDRGGDCTNFTSQVARAGGIPMSGDGSYCNETNGYDWYMYKRWWVPCGGAWSASWGAVPNFRYYMRDRIGAYVAAYGANDEAVSLLISQAQPGDFIQLDVYSDGAWRPQHGVAVIRHEWKGGYYQNDIRYNDHTGAINLNDTYHGSLRSKLNQWKNQGVTPWRRMVWIRMS